MTTVASRFGVSRQAVARIWKRGKESIAEGSESMVGIGNRFIIKSFLIWGFIVLLCSCVAMFLRSVVFLFGDEVVSRDAENEISYFTDKTVLPKLKMNPDGSVEADNVDQMSGGH